MLEIKSIGDTIGGSYIRPDKNLVVKYQEALSQNDKALEYLKNVRKLKDETIAHFRLGYNAELDAIAIPIFKGDELVNIKYRFLNPTEAKYTQEKGCEVWLFNDAGIKSGIKHGRILIVEGEFDLMSVWESGIKNVISPASGKNSYGVWIAQLDNIPEVFIAYDNDVGGKETAKEMADRIGIDKSFEVKYPDGIKDANEFFLTGNLEGFRKLLAEAKPFYSHKFKGVGDIIQSLRYKKDDTVKLPFIPKVEIEKDWLVMISGKSNVGKTAYVLNLAEELAKQDIPVLVMPFERGIESVGKRFLQVKFDKTINDFREIDDSGWDKITEECVETPVYFALPKREEIKETIITARRLFNTKFVIIDHLDYVVRNAQNKEAEIGNTIQELKRIAEEYGIVMLIVHHIRKIEQAGSLLKRKPNIEDLKGSSSTYQDPECVIMLTGDTEGEILVSIVKNKGEMTSQSFDFNVGTGKITLNAFDAL